MQITFLVGNGFDISCGIQSSYSAFYKWYCSQKPSDKAHVNIFRSTINNAIKSGDKDWADFEVAMGKYTSRFTRETVGNYIDCYMDAHNKLVEYLQSESERFSDTLHNEEINRMRNGLKRFYGELSPKEVSDFDSIFNADKGTDSVIRFISFNYTNALDICVECLSKAALETWNYNGHLRALTVDSSIIHVHGKLNRYPVFGVDNTNQIVNQDLLSEPDFVNFMVKPKCVDALGELWHKESLDCIEKSQIICIWGMSLGITDSIWFTKVMDWLKQTPDRHLIVFWYTSTPSNGILPWLTFHNARVVRQRITDFSDLSSEAIEKISSRIHIIENTSRVLRVNLSKKPLPKLDENESE